VEKGIKGPLYQSNIGAVRLLDQIFTPPTSGVARNKFLVCSRGARHCTKRDTSQTGKKCTGHSCRSNSNFHRLSGRTDLDSWQKL
jgi:hypothetical protein